MIHLEALPTPRNPFISIQILQEIPQQILTQDRVCGCQVYSHESLVSLLLKTSGSTLSGRQRVSAFYRAIATCLEYQTGCDAETFVNLNSQGAGWILIFCNRALVFSYFLRDAETFNFESVEQLTQIGREIIEGALTIAQNYFDFSTRFVPWKQAS
ncbi:MAG: NifX-associated nitrogen fixation protein [Oscillatoriales cyanobacterium RM2_1_1]|nr:NifX-associated nitrogen fixation protein [Oscillatoriales cyanobacterium SM2_3_0]NJO45440.1 NifX-associated nitrogen fixation protein [Oscillatoriales cyanobacterium RM2_1_1]